MTETELYKSLGALTKNKEVWEENIPYVESLLSSESVKYSAPRMVTVYSPSLPRVPVTGSKPAAAGAGENKTEAGPAAETPAEEPKAPRRKAVEDLLTIS